MRKIYCAYIDKEDNSGISSGNITDLSDVD